MLRVNQFSSFNPRQSALQAAPLSPQRGVPLFRGVNNFAPQDEQVEKALLDAGLNREKLKKEWDATLWRIIALPGKRVMLAINPGKSTPEQKAALTEALKKPLTVFGEVVVRFQSEEEFCCGGCCRGCAASLRSDKNKTWIG